MGQSRRRLRCWIGVWAAFGALALPVERVTAQDYSGYIVPPEGGATPLSTIIEAQGNLAAAQGSFLESAAMARKINAQAYAQEAQNAFQDVKGYFELRRLNRQYTLEQGNRPDLIRQRKQRAMEELLRNGFQEVLKQADVSRQLNWLLAELCGPGMSVQYLGGSASLPELSERLGAEAKAQIWLTDGGPASKRLEFNLSDGRVLQTPWPPGLRREQFDPLRTEFEAARDQLVKDIEANGQVSETTRKRIILAIDNMLVTLKEVFPHAERANPSVFLEYNLARHYLRSLIGQVNRAMSTDDRSIFTPSHAFQGSTVLELIQYMYRSGLRFAPPKEGGEGTYRNLVESLDNVYVTLAATRHPPAAHPPQTK